MTLSRAVEFLLKTPEHTAEGPGRRVNVLSEPQVLAALDKACSTAFASDAAKQAACEGMIDRHRKGLEDHIFRQGDRDLATM